MNRMLRPTLVALFAAATALAQAPGDNLAMGKMWTFENPPLAYLEQEYGFKPDQKWLDSLRLSALRLGERDNPWCSAAFVSPKGLIMTNHHCVRDNVAKLGVATERPDLVETGYAAKSLEEEVELEDLTVQQLIRQTDVTAAVNEGIAEGDDEATIDEKRTANMAAIRERAEQEHPDQMHQIVTLYQGAVFQLYSYKVYDDIRLVMAVNLHTAHFGGDPDNFTYPRYSIDFSFVRAYENGEPANTAAHYFRWRNEGAKDQELVFVPGNPGSTKRLHTMAQLEFQRDVEYPMTIEQLHNGMDILRPFAGQNPNIETTLLSWENGHKSFAGTLAGLHDPELMALKAGHEERFREAIAQKPELQAAYGNAWERIAELVAKQRELHPKVAFYQASYSPILDRALAIAKAVDGSVDEEERAAAREQAIEMQMFGNQLTNALLVDHFERAAHWLPANDPYLMAVAGEQAGAETIQWALALRAISRSKLASKRFVTELLDGGAEAVQKSDDVGMRVGRLLYTLQREVGKQAETVDAALEVQGARLGKALFAVFGSNVSPDATMTLRFSDGIVAGYPYNGTLAPWSTSFYGLYGRAVEFGHEFPFDLPQPWDDAKERVDMTKRVCFVSTNDIVGGNSGSSVVDKDLQVVGLVFDGNIESLPNDFYYTQTRARAVSVHTDAIVEALSKVYEMSRIVEELRAGAAGKGK